MRCIPFKARLRDILLITRIALAVLVVYMILHFKKSKNTFFFFFPFRRDWLNEGQHEELYPKCWGDIHVFGVIMLFRGALGITHPTPRPNCDQCWRRSMWILSGQGLETSKDRASSSSLSNLYPGCSILQVGILFPNGQAEHSSYCPLLHLLSPLVRVWFWCHCSSWSYAFGLLFIRLDKLSSSTSLQWSCALEP